MLSQDFAPGVIGRPRASHGYVETPTLAQINAATKADRDDWIRETACPACRARTIGRFRAIRHVLYDRCAACGFVFANPIPSERALGHFYNSAFYNNYRLFEQNAISSRPYFSVSHDLTEIRSKIDTPRWARILDFGCGPGSFVALMRDEGFSGIEGLELNRKAVDIAQACYGLTIAARTSELKHDAYDLVTLIEVIEHIARPLAFLDGIRHLVAPGGTLFLATDSVRNFVSRYLPHYAVHYTGPSHISMFTESAMEAMLQNAGFKVLTIERAVCQDLLGYFCLSPFYSLDFLSPRHDGDGSDILFVPTRLGKALDLKQTRKLPRMLRALQRIDRTIATGVRHLMDEPFTGHMFVTAVKV